MANRFIGIDLTSPYVVRGAPRPVTVAEFLPDGNGLNGAIRQLPNVEWPDDWPETAAELNENTPLPANWPGEDGDTLWLALDGPQGLAGQPDANARLCELQSGAPGRTPYEYPVPGRMFAGYITGSVVLWSLLSRFRHPNTRIDGFEPAPAEAVVNLCEVFPGVTWRDLTRLVDQPARHLHNKTSRQGKLERIALLRAIGARIADNVVNADDADDVLDAALAAIIAYAWSQELDTPIYGIPPIWDPNTLTLREGLIRSLRYQGLDFTEVDHLIQGAEPPPPPVHDVVLAADEGGDNIVIGRANLLLSILVAATRWGNNPAVCSFKGAYEWIFTANYVGQGHAQQVIQAARVTEAAEFGLGDVFLDTFIVNAGTSSPGDGHWNDVDYTQAEWVHILGNATLLASGDAIRDWMQQL